MDLILFFFFLQKQWFKNWLEFVPEEHVKSSNL